MNKRIKTKLQKRFGFKAYPKDKEVKFLLGENFKTYRVYGRIYQRRKKRTYKHVMDSIYFESCLIRKVIESGKLPYRMTKNELGFWMVSEYE